MSKIDLYAQAKKEFSSKNFSTVGVTIFAIGNAFYESESMKYRHIY